MNNNNVITHLYVSAPRGIDGNNFVAKYYQPGMTLEEAQLLIATHPDIAPLKLRDRVRTYLYVNATQCINGDKFVTKYYQPGMTLEEAQNLLTTHPDIAPLKLRDRVRTYLYVNATQCIDGDEFVTKYYQPGMTLEEAQNLLTTHPDIAPLKLRDRVRTHLYVNAPLGLYTIYTDDFVVKNYQPGMTLEEAKNLLATHPVITIMFNIRFRPDVIYTMHTPMPPNKLYLTLNSYYVDGMPEDELSRLSFTDQSVRWIPSLHNTFSHTCNSMVITFLLCIQRNVFNGILPYLPEELIFEILLYFRRQDFISN
jgi:hypothetical protein